jgi:glycosyltransferase involved in cell wall biosynthesis
MNKNTVPKAIPPKKLTGQGIVDAINSFELSGWIYLEDSETLPTVELRINGKPVARTQPESDRPDVNRIFGVKGPTGFKISLPPNLALISGCHLEIVCPEAGFALTLHENVLKFLRGQQGEPFTVDDRTRLLASEHEKIRRALQPYPDALKALNRHPDIRLQTDPGLGNIHIINGCENTISERFRVWQLAATLQALGYSPLVFSRSIVRYLRQRSLKAVVYVRCSVDQELQDHMDFHRNSGARLIADFDDLVFEPALITDIDGVRYLSEADRLRYIVGMRGYRKMLKLADLAILSTPALANFAATVNTSVAVLSNYPLPAAVAAAEALAKHPGPERSDNTFKVGYFSGTLTHQRDFGTCAAGVAAFMHEVQTARLVIVGHLDLAEFPELKAFDSRIDRLAFVPYGDMIRIIHECDVVIAPLEIGNAFCESKSELKYFDAALVGVPTIASGTDVYRKAIQHRQNGLIAVTEYDWYDALKLLAFSPDFKRKLGANARSSVLNEYSVQRQRETLTKILSSLGISETLDAPGAMVRHRDVGQVDDATIKSVSIVMPDIFAGSGGHRKLLLLAEEFSRRGKLCELVVISERSKTAIVETIDKFDINAKFSVRPYLGIVPEADLVIASSWNTVEIVASARTSAKRYFVQDYEPFFMPMGTEYLQAYDSYRQGLRTVCLGRWVSKKLLSEFDIDVKATDFPIDHDVYFPRRKWEARENIILFYARPDQPRRLFSLGREAIIFLRGVLPGWRIIMFGAVVEDIEGVENMGKLGDLDQIAEMYSRARLGISFSATNPSLVGLEMLASGLPVIDVKTLVGTPDYEDCEAIEFVHPHVDALISTVTRLVRNSDVLQERSKAALEWARSLPTDTEFARHAVNLMMEP